MRGAAWKLVQLAKPLCRIPSYRSLMAAGRSAVKPNWCVFGFLAFACGCALRAYIRTQMCQWHTNLNSISPVFFNRISDTGACAHKMHTEEKPQIARLLAGIVGCPLESLFYVDLENSEQPNGHNSLKTDAQERTYTHTHTHGHGHLRTSFQIQSSHMAIWHKPYRTIDGPIIDSMRSQETDTKASGTMGSLNVYLFFRFMTGG